LTVRSNCGVVSIIASILLLCQNFGVIASFHRGFSKSRCSISVMMLVKFADLRPWLLPIVVAVMVVAGFGGYFYTVNRQTTHSLDVDLSNQDQSLYNLIQTEGRELVLLEGVVSAIGLEQTENITFPDQYFVTVQNQQQPQALYRISLGPPQKPLRVFYPNRQNQPEAIVTETVSAKALADLLKRGNRVAVELSFPLNQPEIKTAFMGELNQFVQGLEQSNDRTVFEVHYFRTHRVYVYE
jgi:hypothetical protein